MSLRQKIANLGGVALIGIASMVGGCEEALTPGDMFAVSMAGYQTKAKTAEQAQGIAAVGQIGSTAANRQHEVNVAREGRTVVNIGNKNGHQSPKSLVIFTCNRIVDINKDKLIDFKSEVFGLNKGTYNIDEEKMGCYLYNRTPYRTVLFRSWTSDGRLIGETEIYFPKGRPFRGRFTDPSTANQGDFMDNIKGEGPGDYRITATLNDRNNTTVYTNVKVIRDK